MENQNEISFIRLTKRALIITLENSLVRWNSNQSIIRKNLMIDYLAK